MQYDDNINIYHGMNLRDARRAARLLGCDSRKPRRTGEEIYTHPFMTKPVRCDSRRKDATRELTSWLLRIREMRRGDDNRAA